jgi:phosphatidate phosphatase PAH1
VISGAPAAFTALVGKGYRPLYLTARPNWLTARTREFLNTNGFPHGMVHTTTGLSGAIGANAAIFKTGELAAVLAKGFVIDYGFGNTSTDAEAYDAAALTPLDHRVFFQFTDSVFGGRRIEDYNTLVPEFSALAPVCQ